MTVGIDLVDPFVDKLTYKIAGKGHPILMIHGWGMSFTTWEKMSGLLAHHFQLIQIALPEIDSNQEMTMQEYMTLCIEHLEATRKKLQITKWDVVSYSLGARVHEFYLLHCPQFIGKSMFLCPLMLRRWQVWLVQAMLVLDKFFPFTGNWILSSKCLYYVIFLLAFNTRAGDGARIWHAEIQQCPLYHLKITMRYITQIANKRLSPLQDTAYVWGNRDKIVAVKHRFFTRSKHFIIDTGHALPWCAAEEVSGIIASWLKSTLGSLKNQ